MKLRVAKKIMFGRRWKRYRRSTLDAMWKRWSRHALRQPLSIWVAS